MTLKSMTGFARADGVHGTTSWYWEARSVNGRNLELRLRVPLGFEGLEIKARNLAQEKLTRGNCTLNLGARREAGKTEIKAPRLDTLLAMRGVVEAVEPEASEEAEAALNHALLVGLAIVLDELVR